MLYSDKVQMISEIYKFFEIASKIDQKIEKIENSPNSEVEILSLL
jgi:hypothetical protein